ncbi:50S ribosomal protein L11 methyltransferase [Candidatus Woesearchaeota archaeon]|nr:50S ribosomal protein L11 methyltransferase [Candidatus Woesearchaeota archaeon]
MEQIKLKKLSKSGLAIALSALEGFSKPEVRLEQYPTDSEVAASVIWNAYQLGDINGKEVVDLGCGSGILGIGALLLGAKKVSFVDINPEAIDKARKNANRVKSEGSASFYGCPVERFSEKGEVIVMNPPFGTKSEHADREFLIKAFHSAPTIYSFHKTSTKLFVESIAKDSGLVISHRWDFSFPLKASLPFHRRRIHNIAVSCFRFVREEKDGTSIGQKKRNPGLEKDIKCYGGTGAGH